MYNLDKENIKCMYDVKNIMSFNSDIQPCFSHYKINYYQNNYNMTTYEFLNRGCEKISEYDKIIWIYYIMDYCKYTNGLEYLENETSLKEFSMIIQENIDNYEGNLLFKKEEK